MDGRGGQLNEKSPPSAECRQRRLAVLKEYADRYRDKIAGWWFDGMELDTYKAKPDDWRTIESIVHPANPKAVIAFSYGGNEQACVCQGVDDYTGGDTWSKQDLKRLDAPTPAGPGRHPLARQDLLRKRLSRPGRRQPVQRPGADRLDQDLQHPGRRLHAGLALRSPNRAAQGVRARAIEENRIMRSRPANRPRNAARTNPPGSRWTSGRWPRGGGTPSSASMCTGRWRRCRAGEIIFLLLAQPAQEPADGIGGPRPAKNEISEEYVGLWQFHQRTYGPGFKFRILRHCFGPRRSTRTIGPVFSPARRRNTWFSRPNTTMDSASGPAPKPAGAGAALGTRWTSGPSRTWWAN